jgi:thioesterase domain-containing protein
VRVYVLDQQRQLVPIGVPGELYVAGDGLSEGYLHHLDWTAEKFVTLDLLPGRPLANRTGDRVRFLPDGNLEYLGRFDEQKKVRGYRVEVEEIENVLSTFSGVRQCAVAVDEDRYGHPRIVAYVVSLEQKAFDSHGLRSWLQQKLPDFMLPALFVALEQLPLTPSGKINRSALPRPGAEWHSQAAVVIPRDATEQVLVKIWEHVLDRRPIGVNEDFFELGGHSFLAIRLMAEIKSITGKDIPVSALFQGATVEHLASVIKNGGGRFSYPLIMELRDKPQATEYSEAPFFCVAAPGVNAIGYLSLRRHMNRRRPLYKLQAPRPGGTAGGEGGRFYTAKEWETLAQEYCLALRFVQPHGPYYLGGMCGGAIAAYEVARLLESQGETVGLVAVFDTWVHEGTEVPFLVSIHWYSMRARQILRLPPEERWVQLWQLFRRRYDRLTHPQRRRDGASTTSSISAVLKSNGALYGGTVTVFRRRRQPYFRIRDRQLGWGMRTTGKVEVLEIATPIHEVVLREPFVKELAQRLDEKLCAVNTIYHGGLGR